MNIFDWFMAILILGLAGSVVFGVLLQVVVSMMAVVYRPAPRGLSVRQHYYDFDKDEI